MAKVIGKIETLVGEVKILGTDGTLRDATVGGAIHAGEQIVSTDPGAQFEVKYLALEETSIYEGIFRVLADGSVIAGVDAIDSIINDKALSDLLETAAGQDEEAESSGYIPSDVVATSSVQGFSRDGNDTSSKGNSSNNDGENNIDTNDFAPTAEDGANNAIEDGNIVTGQLVGADLDGNSFDFVLVDDLGEGEGTVTLNSNGSYVYNVDADFQDLRIGETREVTFTYKTVENTTPEGYESEPATVTITVTGTNDQPVVEHINVNGYDDVEYYQGEDQGDNQYLQNYSEQIYETHDSIDIIGEDDTQGEDGNNILTGTLSVFDLDTNNVNDINDTHIFEVFGDVSIVNPENVDITAGREGEEVDVKVSITFNEDTQEWEYKIDGDFSELAAGETSTLTFDYVAIDNSDDNIAGDSGNLPAPNESDTSEPKTITLTITGTNDQPIVDNITVDTVIFETHDAVAYANGENDTQDDVLTTYSDSLATVQDDDVNDTHVYHLVGEDSYYGEDNIDIVEATVTDSTDGNLGITASVELDEETGEYTVSGDFNALADGETATVTFQYYAVDDSGAGEGTDNDESSVSELKTVTLTITGTNDQPIVEDIDANYVTSASVAVFDNGAYVDTSGGSNAESDNIQATLASQGHDVTAFIDDSESGFESALADVNTLVMPETERGSYTNLPDGAKDAIYDFVNNGGTLVINSTSSTYDTAFLNDMFGWSLSDGDIFWSTGGHSFSITSDANGTSYEDAASSLPDNDGTYTIDTDSLPDGALNLYADDEGNTAVFSVNVGGGIVVFLAYDWYNAEPAGTYDGGWLDILDIAVSTSTVYETHDDDAYQNGVDDTQDDVTTTFNGNLATVSDDDVTDEHTYEVVTATLSEDSGIVTDLTVTITDAVTGDYTITGNFNALAAGETATVTFDYVAIDNSGVADESAMSEPKTVTLVITGTNDQPIANEVTLGINEIIYETHDNDAYQNAEDDTSSETDIGEDSTTILSGTLSTTDDDVNNTHVFNVEDMMGEDSLHTNYIDIAYDDGVLGVDDDVTVKIESNYIDLSNITLDSLTLLDNDGGSDRSTGFDLVGNFNALAAGETATVTFMYTVDDQEGFGGEDANNEASISEPKLVTITVTGTNDQPVITDIQTRDALETDLISVTYGANIDVALTDVASDTAEGSALKVVLDTAAGETVSFDWAFDLRDWDYMQDAAFVVVDGVVTKLADGSIDANGTFEFTFATAGEHTVVIGVLNNHDNQGFGGSSLLAITNTNGGELISIETFGAVSENANGYDMSANSDLSAADLDAFIDLQEVTYENAHLSGNLDEEERVDVSDDDNNDDYTYVAFTDRIVEAQNIQEDTSGNEPLITTPVRVTLDENGDYDVISSSFDKLGEGESVTITFDIQVRDTSGVDDNGDTNSEAAVSEPKTVTIVITGTNDSPVLNSITTDTDIMETDLTGTAENSVLTGTLVADISDEDMNDSHDFVAFGAEVAVVADNHGVITGDTIVSLDSNGNYTVINESFNNLGMNETVTVSFDVQVTDGTTGLNGGESAISNTQTVTLNISGTNDQPVVQGVSVAIVDSGAIALNGNTTTSVDYWNFTHSGGELTIDTLTEMNNNGNPWIQDGSGVYNDLNEDGVQTSLDVMVRVYEINADGSRGALVGTNDDSNNPGADGSLWNRDSYLSLNLASGEYQLVVGAWDLSEAEVNIGANDIDEAGWHYEGPYQISITGSDGVQMVDQNVIFEAENGNTVFENDLPDVSDEDTNDTHVYSLVDGTVAISDPSITDFSVTVDANGHYILDGDFNSLAIGQRATVTFEYVADDQQGADGTGLDENSISEPATVTIVVVGTNDGAIITVPNGQDEGQVAEDLILTVDGHLVVSDVDAGEAVFSTIVEADPANSTSFGTFTIDAGGAWLYVLDNDAAQVLGDESVVETYIVSSIDGTASQSVDITINGQNDAPVITGVTGNNTIVTENDVIDGVTTEATTLVDVDATDVDGPTMTFTIISGDPYGYFEIDSNGVVTLTQYGVDEVAASHVNDQTFNLGIEVSDGVLNDTTIVTIVVDDNFVDIPTIDLPASMDSGVSDSDNLTNTPTLNLGNIAADVLTISVIENSVLQAQATRLSISGAWIIDNAGDGSLSYDSVTNEWSFTADSTVADGEHTYSVVVVDDAGNEAVSLESVLVIDTTAPTIDTSGIADNVNETLSDVNLGQVSASDLNGPVILSVSSGFTLDVNGDLTLNGEVDFEDDTSHTVTITATDAAGNIATQDVTVNVNNITGTVLYTSAQIMQTFDGYNTEGWSGQGTEHYPTQDILGWFDKDSDTRSQTFDLSDSAGESANISFDLGIFGFAEGVNWVSTGLFSGYFEPYGNGWEGNDTFRVRITDSDGNPIETENFSPDGNYTGGNMIGLDLDITVPQDGEITVEFKSANTVDGLTGNESWSIDNFQIDGESREVLNFNNSASGEIDLSVLIGQANDFENDSGVSVSNPNSLDEIDLSVGNHTLLNITLQDVITMTDDDNILKITGDSADAIENLADNGWSTNSVDVDGYHVYTNTDTNAGDSAQLLIDIDILITVD